MKVYNFSASSKEFIGEKDALKDPIEGKFLLPSNATFIKPGKSKNNFVQAFIKDKWVNIEDHRKKIFYDKNSKHKIKLNSIGPIPDFLTDKAPQEFDVWNNNKNIWSGHNEKIEKEEKEKKEQEQFIKDNKWKFDRVEGYLSMGDQLDMIYWDKINNTNKWIDHIKKIKDQYPKP